MMNFIKGPNSLNLALVRYILLVVVYTERVSYLGKSVTWMVFKFWFGIVQLFIILGLLAKIFVPPSTRIPQD